MWLKQSIVQVIPFGPFLDSGDGKTLEIGLLAALDHATTGIMLSENGGTLAVREQGANFVASTYDAHGCYKVSLSAIDTGTLGRLRVIYTDPTTNLPVWQDCMVVPVQVWDSLFGADKLDVAVVEQANLDFGALQKVSLNAATPASVQNLTQGATAGELTAAKDAIIAVLPSVDGLALEVGIEAHVAAALAAYDLPTRAEATADKEAILSAVGQAGSGTGAITWTYTLTRSDNGLPIADAEVWITTDVTGQNVIASGRTNQNGMATFYLDAGTVYVWRQKSGFIFTNPDTEVVS